MESTLTGGSVGSIGVNGTADQSSEEQRPAMEVVRMASRVGGVQLSKDLLKQALAVSVFRNNENDLEGRKEDTRDWNAFNRTLTACAAGKCRSEKCPPEIAQACLTDLEE